MESGKKFIVGNWKMHGSPDMACRLTGEIARHRLPPQAEVVLCPPAALLAHVSECLQGSRIKLGAQDCHWQAEGAFTGDIGAPMLKSAGCDFVIVGHSERRTHHRETSEEVRKKAAAAIAAGLIPIVCVGETEAERDAGQAEAIVGTQVKESLPGECGEGNFILAYEPVWAIGTGKTPTANDIQAMHAHVLAVASKQTGLAKSQIYMLYGGSVKAANAKEILAIGDVGGALVGGASLKAEEFCRIIEAV